MPPEIQFGYFLADSTNPVEIGGAIWNAPIPMRRDAVSQTGAESVSYGDYFRSIRSFLTRERCRHLTTAASSLIGREVVAEEIERVEIYQEKHGEFYHPARVRLSIGSAVSELVLNCALSKAGKDIIHREFDLLKRLNLKRTPSFLPMAYSLGAGRLDPQAPGIPMFLGQWLEGYHEFHQTASSLSGENTLVVWDPRKGPVRLGAEAVRDIHRQVAYILTCYYDLETFEQIYPWHHAAGDFVVALNDAGVRLKLITVRNYISFTERTPAGAPEYDQSEIALAALLVFLINLSIRNRLDRLDGTGEIAWSGDFAVAATIEGFFQSLACKSPVPGIPGAPAEVFFDYLCSYSRTALRALADAIVEGYNPKAPEMPVIEKHLGQHMAIFYETISN